jgi:radical SAM superfamily enzyme YgiQ (UPF0313 family)
MPDIVLTTLNAKYIHAAFGLRYLLANLGQLRPRAELVEFDINQRPLDIAEALLARQPAILGFGIYIWNVAPTTEVVAIVRRLRPGVIIVLGGPEISYEVEQQPLAHLADHIITGEADLKFAETCKLILERRAISPSGNGGPPARIESASGPAAPPKIIAADPPDFSQLTLPYDLYTDEDIAHRVLYVEASRGCPFTCEFCLSSLDIPVRHAPLPPFLEHLQRLLDRGARQLKFVDRTFNLNIQTSRAILEFLLQRCRPGHLFHFEMIPDRLPPALREVIARFPPGALQFEVGIQTFNEQVGGLIQRRQDNERLEDNLRFLRRDTGVHVHADLIAGLPGETLESFAAGFDRLTALQPHEIQVGILKRLRGTPITRHDAAWGMVYNPQPPYEVLETKLIDFGTLQQLRRFARYWDLAGNSGNFIETTPLLWSGPGDPPRSPFRAFWRWTEWLHARVGRTDAIALIRLMELLFEFLVSEARLDPKTVAAALWRDYKRGGRRDKPAFLKEHLAAEPAPGPVPGPGPRLARRQARHWA